MVTLVRKSSNSKITYLSFSNNIRFLFIIILIVLCGCKLLSQDDLVSFKIIDFSNTNQQSNFIESSILDPLVIPEGETNYLYLNFGWEYYLKNRYGYWINEFSYFINNSTTLSTNSSDSDYSTYSAIQKRTALSIATGLGTILVEKENILLIFNNRIKLLKFNQSFIENETVNFNEFSEEIGSFSLIRTRPLPWQSGITTGININYKLNRFLLGFGFENFIHIERAKGEFIEQIRIVGESETLRNTKVRLNNTAFRNRFSTYINITYQL